MDFDGASAIHCCLEYAGFCTKSRLNDNGLVSVTRKFFSKLFIYSVIDNLLQSLPLTPIKS